MYSSASTRRGISLRGINTDGGTNPTVSVLIDDVQFGSSTYLGKPPLPDLDPATLKRVGVLREPKGTLTDASSLVGLIKYVTKGPSATEFLGLAEAGVNTVGRAGRLVGSRIAERADLTGQDRHDRQRLLTRRYGLHRQHFSGGELVE
ncbi:TonB-dependent receptor plug domain-containing protein [Sphingobium sp. AP50]|uniref:TonB-dependent receptor plug domain-containing protein n=1 Tax=Sphingobium sp. AP50 TaxID=1884369 RepID=UPI00352846D3